MPTPEPQKPAPVAHEKAHGFRRKMTGTVIKAKMQKTIVVECVSYRRDPLYGKYIKERRRYKAHDEKNEFKTGDEVEITEHAPIAKSKRFTVTRLVKKYVEVVTPHLVGDPEPVVPVAAPSKRSVKDVAKAAEAKPS
jgi:small subunit ribosomal protein S17